MPPFWATGLSSRKGAEPKPERDTKAPTFANAMAGVVDPFPRQAGAAAGMFGLLTMIVAAAVGSWIGASHDGTLRPLAFTVAGAALAVFAAVRLGVRGVDAAGRKHR